MAARYTISCSRVKSLAWADDELIDWAGGGTVYALDGTGTDSAVNFSYRFDAAVATGDCRTAVIHERFGTKGFVLHDGKILREIDRSFHQAQVYEFPVCLWSSAEGRTLLAHCPDAYNQIEIEDAVTGERLTDGDRDPDDFFHSRLQVNPSGSRLISAGWIWHPVDAVKLFDVPTALADPHHLDREEPLDLTPADREFFALPSACWQSDDVVLIATNAEQDHEVILQSQPDANQHGLAVCDAASGTVMRSVSLDRPTGTMMPVGKDQVVTFFGHPRLISLADGSVVEEWPDLPSGRQESSICGDQTEATPPLALDPRNHRFALAQSGEIHVVCL